MGTRQKIGKTPSTGAAWEKPLKMSSKIKISIIKIYSISIGAAAVGCAKQIQKIKK